MNEKRYRSFWYNLLPALAAGTFTPFFIGMCFEYRDVPVSVAVFAVLAVANSVLAVRMFGATIIVSPAEVIATNAFRTHRVPLAEIEEFIPAHNTFGGLLVGVGVLLFTGKEINFDGVRSFDSADATSYKVIDELNGLLELWRDEGPLSSET